MDKLPLHSPDLTQRNLDALADLFPNVITETRDADGNVVRAVDFDRLRQELADHVVEGPQERYQLDWPGKRAAQFAANAPIAKTLRPDCAESVDFDTTQNLFIEGDNLDALKLLQESYLGKVKLIYIDPPYNTGNDFVYDDDFAQTTAEYLAKSGQVDEQGNRLVANTEANGRFHSDWLSMMYPRLKLARNLLTDDGLIFVSIDDHELHSLRQVLGEVFGNDNFVGLITRATGTPTGGGFDGFTNMVDYLLVFRRSEMAWLRGLDFGDEDAAIYNEEDENGKYLTRSLRRTGGEDRREDRPSMFYGVEAPDGTAVFPTGPGGYESRWICGRQRYDEMVQEGLIQWKKVDRGAGPEWHPYQKFYLEGREKRPSNLWLDVEGNKKATRDLRKLFDAEKVFDSPKPVGLIEQVIKIGTDKDSVVLDFFAGSATTAEAVARVNVADGGLRKFLMVQIPEECPPESAAARQGYATIAEIARERIRRAGAKIKAESGNKAKGLDIGFRALRVDTTSLADVRRTPGEQTQAALGLFTDSIRPGRTGEDLLFEVLLAWGLELTLPVARATLDGHEVFIVDDGALIACFDARVTPGVITAIARRRPLRAVFRDSGFATDAERINAEQIFRELSPGTDVKAL